MLIQRRSLLAAGAFAVVSRAAAAAVPGRQAVTLTYLGNAGWLIEDGRTVVVVDPYVTMFREKRASRPRGGGNHEDPLMVPDEGLIATHIPRADFILATHSHSDHMLDAPILAKRTGAVIIGSNGSATLARSQGVPEAQLIIIKGGEDLEFGRFSLRVIPSLHSELFAKHYNNLPLSGAVSPDIKPPLHESDYRESGTYAYLLRISGHKILIMGGMNYIEREMEGLRPDIALIGANLSRNENFDYAGRLMRALGDPPIVFPTHWDSYATKTDAQARAEAATFANEIHAASPDTRVIVPDYFSPIRLP